MVAMLSYAAAGVYLGRGAEILRALPDFNKLRLFSSSYGRGWIHYLQAEYPQAVRYWEGALRDRVEAFGEDDGEGLHTQLHQSLKFYDSVPHYQAQRARCHFKTNQILRYKGLVSAAEGALQMACELKNGLVKPEEVRRP
ncbi:hypothetical protein OEA41_001704 [Lepraria neglecta]|uniref:Uncharacterized protein n=1 Tax=Lepraria neglecta TaxID=209136 RepID=A0AAD9ZB72_9LECA|nr:hypothetical protein OEA41_001704 [Lepraria neglecta]